MIGTRSAERRLNTFLGRYGISVEALASEVEESYGEPLLVVATGSVLHGFGNDRSDIDLNVVVDRERLTMLPIPAYRQGALIDTIYFTAADAGTWSDELGDSPWPPRGRMMPQDWRRRQSLLINCVRFGYGLVLDVRDDWDGWVAGLRQPWLRDRVVEWWWTESLRWRLAGRWLAPRKPLLAAQRYCEAVLAALEVRAAAAGELFLSAKWLPEKLRGTGDGEGLEIAREVLRAPTTSAAVPLYLARCETLLERLLPDHGRERGLVAQLWPASGVAGRRLDGRTLVSRWDLRGIELRGVTLPEPPSEPIWTGPLDRTPEAPFLALFVEDMTWLGLTARD